MAGVHWLVPRLDCSTVVDVRKCVICWKDLAWLGHVARGKQDERTGDEHPLVPGWLRVTHGLEQQLCCDRFLEVKVSNGIWR